MSGRWIKINSDMLHDIGALRLSNKEFKRQALAAMDGQDVYLSKFIRPCHGRPGQTEWAALRNEIFKRDDYTCRYCGERGKRLECDHVFPVSRGGTHAVENLVTACFVCNRSKRNKTLDEWNA